MKNKNVIETILFCKSRAKNIFTRMDENGDGSLTEEEFLRGCLQDDELSKMLAPNVCQ